MDGDGQLEQRKAVAAATILERGIVGFVWLD